MNVMNKLTEEEINKISLSVENHKCFIHNPLTERISYQRQKYQLSYEKDNFTKRMVPSNLEGYIACVYYHFSVLVKYYNACTMWLYINDKIERCEDNHKMKLSDLEEEEEGKKEWEKRHHDQLWKIRVNLDNYTYEDKIFKYILFPRIDYSVVEEKSSNPETYFTEQPKTNERFLMSENIFPDTDTGILYERTENSDIESDEEYKLDDYDEIL